MFGLFEKKKVSPRLLLTLGSGSVSVAVISPGTIDTPAKVWDYERGVLPQNEQALPSDALYKRLVEVSKSTAQLVVERHTKRKRPAFSEVIVVVHPPWALSETCEYEEHFDQETLVTEAHIRDFAKKALEKCSFSKGNPFEKAVTRVEINGYPTHHPEGTRGKRLRVVALASTASHVPLDTFVSAIQTVLPGTPVTLQSSAHMFLAAFQPLSRTVPQITLINVTSESTGLLLSKEGAILAYQQAPLGWRELVRNLAQKYGTTPDEALSRLRMSIEDACDDASCLEVLSSLNGAAPAFITAYGKIFTEATTQVKAPATAIVIAPPDVAGWFVDLCTKIDFAQFTNTGQPFSVRLIDMSYLAEFAIFAPGLTPDTGVALAATFVHNSSLEDEK